MAVMGDLNLEKRACFKFRCVGVCDIHCVNTGSAHK